MPTKAVNALPIDIHTAIAKASKATGADFEYLVDTAKRESSFKPHAKARTSSASGLFQFIKSTWLAALKQDGPALGLGKYAKYISKTKDGDYFVANPKLRKMILDLRFKPDVAALVAGAHSQRNAEALSKAIDRPPTSGELYSAHFLGVGNAAKLINAVEQRPKMRADRLFPGAAKANRSIFYRRGRAISVSQLYQNLIKHHDDQKTISLAQQKTIETVRRGRTIGQSATGQSATGQSATGQSATGNKAPNQIEGVHSKLSQPVETHAKELTQFWMGEHFKRIAPTQQKPLVNAGGAGIWQLYKKVAEDPSNISVKQPQNTQTINELRGPILDQKHRARGSTDVSALFRSGGLSKTK